MIDAFAYAWIAVLVLFAILVVVAGLAVAFVLVLGLFTGAVRIAQEIGKKF